MFCYKRYLVAAFFSGGLLMAFQSWHPVRMSLIQTVQMAAPQAPALLASSESLPGTVRPAPASSLRSMGPGRPTPNWKGQPPGAAEQMPKRSRVILSGPPGSPKPVSTFQPLRRVWPAAIPSPRKRPPGPSSGSRTPAAQFPPAVSNQPPWPLDCRLPSEGRWALVNIYGMRPFWMAVYASLDVVSDRVAKAQNWEGLQPLYYGKPGHAHLGPVTFRLEGSSCLSLIMTDNFEFVERCWSTQADRAPS